MHELIKLQKAVAAADAGHFVVLLYVVWLYVAVPDKEGYGLADVYALLDGRQMVGEHGDADGFFPHGYLIINRSDESLVEILYGAELQVEVAVVARIVACHYVVEEKLRFAQGINCSLCLALVVGVGEAGGTGNFNDIQASVATYALYEVDG